MFLSLSPNLVPIGFPCYTSQTLEAATFRLEKFYRPTLCSRLQCCLFLTYFPYRIRAFLETRGTLLPLALPEAGILRPAISVDFTIRSPVPHSRRRHTDVIACPSCVRRNSVLLKAIILLQRKLTKLSNPDLVRCCKHRLL